VVNTEELMKKAKGYALRLFKLRPRSEAELISKLRNKGYTAEISLKLTEELKALGYIDDVAFAKCWMQGRLKKYGYSRVARELGEKGISKDTMAALWESFKPEYDEESLVRSLAQRRIRLGTVVDPLKRKKRIFDYLVRRGFSLASINKVIRDL